MAQPQSKSDPAGAPEDSPYALMNAILNCELDHVSALIRGGADVNFVDAFGDSAMRLAVRMGLDQVADWLIQAGASLEERRHWESLRPRAELNAAIRQGDQKSVVRLLDFGCDPNTPDDWGGTPLHWALDENHPEILLENGADVQARREGFTPVQFALKVGHLPAVALLRAYGAVE